MSEPNIAAQMGPCPDCDEMVWGRRTYKTLGSIPSLERDHCKVVGSSGQGVVYFHEPPEGRQMYTHEHTWRFDGEGSDGVRFRCVRCGAETHSDVSP